MIDLSEGTPEELFVHALELDAPTRERFLSKLERARPELATELASLLECESRTGVFLGEPASLTGDAASIDSGSPERIGGYRVLGLLGEGGMGVVYLAEQEHPRRTVALKVLRPALASPRLRARFEREVELLGRLAHRGIARIYEAGLADAGAGPQPFLAMEHVRGRALDLWLDARGAEARERVELLTQVCDAVEHAHAQGIVHRDLKPANVLVDESGARPEVKVLDFGVARALDASAESESGSAALHTATGQLVGTLPYMSPEQAAGGPRGVDARSDVYALGVLAYELLSGRRPYELQELSMIEAAQVIRERDPEPLASFDRTLRGDLETIIGKALAKEPQRRYASAGELGADLRRWLEGRAVLARPPSRTDQLVRLARRHRAFFAGLGATLLALSIGLGLALRQNALLRAERDRAAEQERNARAVASWFEGLLASPSPWDGARDVSLREVLERGARELSEEVRSSPAIEARVRLALGETLAKLGDLERARGELTLAYERALAAHGAEQPETLIVRARLGDLALRGGALDEAERELSAAHAGLERALGAGAPETLFASDGLARCDGARGRNERALARMRANLDAWHALGSSQRVEALTSANNLARLLVEVGRFEEAIALLEPALAEGRELEGARHPNSLMKANNLANALVRAGRAEEALPLLEEQYAAAVEVLGPTHLDALTCRLNLGTSLKELGRIDEAVPHLRAVLVERERLLGANHLATATARNNLASACAKAGWLDEAEGHFSKAIAALEALPEGGVVQAAFSRGNLALVHMNQGRAELACADLEQAVATLEDEFGPDDWQVAWMRASLADALRAAGLRDAAALELERALPVLERELGADHPRVQAASERAAALNDD